MSHLRNAQSPFPAGNGSATSISPLAEIVARSLRHQIIEGVLPVGMPLPSERTLAEQHSVSRTVVRDAVGALAREGLLLQSDRCRPVVAAPRVPARKVGALRFGVWLWPQADDYFASSVFRGIQQAARGADLRLLVGTASHESWDDDVESEARFIRQLVETEGADGVILWYLGGNRNLPVLLEARSKGLEFVFIDRKPPEGFEADYVGTENVGAARNAVAHLAELGHRRIAFVGNLDSASTVAERYRGYLRALDDAGIQPDPSWRLCFGPHDSESDASASRRVVEDFLALRPRPTALFAVNDSVALGILEAFRDLGVSVPEEVSVVGFDGLLHWIPGGGPLTTARQNFPSIGEHAGEVLLARLASISPSTYRHILLDAPLSHGGSTALCGNGLDLGPSAEMSGQNHEISSQSLHPY